MKRLLCASLTALVFALPLYAQNTPSSTTPSTPDSTMGSETMKSGSGTESSSPSLPSSDSQMQQEPSTGSKKYHKKTEKIEMQEESAPSDASGSTMQKDSSSTVTDEVESEE